MKKRQMVTKVTLALLSVFFCIPAISSAEVANLAAQTFVTNTMQTSTTISFFPDDANNGYWTYRYGGTYQETAVTPTNYSISFPNVANAARTQNFARYIASPEITGEIGKVYFKTRITTLSATSNPAVFNVYLCSTNGLSTGNALSLANETPIATCTLSFETDGVEEWIERVCTLNTNVTGKSIIIARVVAADPSSPTVAIDDIYVKAIASELRFDELRLHDNSTSVVADGFINPEIAFSQVGTIISNVAVTLNWKKTSDETYTTTAMIVSNGVYTLSEPIAVGSSPFSQIEMYASYSYMSDEGAISDTSYSAENPLRIDILPRCNETSVSIIDGWSASLSMSSNYLWIGGMNKADAALSELNTYAVRKSGSNTKYGKTGVLPPFGTSSGNVTGNSSFNKPDSISRDVIFSYSELLGGGLSVEYGDYQSFEKWTDTGLTFEHGAAIPGDKWGMGQDSYLADDASSEQSVTNHFVFINGSTEDGFLVSPRTDNGILKVGFRFKKAGELPATIVVEKILADGNIEEIARFSGLHTDLFKYESVTLRDPKAIAVRIRADAVSVYIDDVSVTDLSSIEIKDVRTIPDPMIATKSAAGRVSMTKKYGVKVSEVKLFYKKTDEASFTSESEALTMNASGDFYQTSEYGPIPAMNDDLCDIQYYVRVKYRNWDDIGTYENYVVYTPTNLLRVTPMTDFGGFRVVGDIAVDMRSIANHRWSGILAPGEANPSAEFKFERFSSDLNSTNYFGDSTAGSAPWSGSLTEDVSFSEFSISDRALVFALDESDNSYTVQNAYYNPMETCAGGNGWTFGSATEALNDPGVSGAAVRFNGGNGNDSHVTLTRTSAAGIGSVGFWAAILPGSEGVSTFVVKKALPNGSFENVAGGEGTITKSTYRYYEINVADSSATKVQILFKGSSAIVDELSVSDVGSYIEIPEAFYSYNGVPGAPISNPDGSATNLVDFGTVPCVGVRIDAINNALISGVNVGYVRLGGTERTNYTALVGYENGVYSNTMPYLAAGSVRYWYEVSYNGVGAPSLPVRYPSSDSDSFYYVTGTTLSTDREPDFTLIKDSNAISLDYNQNPWLMLRVAKKSSESEDAIIFPNLLNNRDAYIQSPTNYNGIGTIYFKAWSSVKSEDGFVLEVSLVNENSEITKISDVTINTTSAETAALYAIKVNNYSQSVGVRIVRKPGGADGNIFLTDVVVSPPPANVYVSEPRVISPGYPSRDDDVTFELEVVSRPGPYPASEFDPTLYWQWIGSEDNDNNEWNDCKFTKVGEEDGVWKFEYTLPHEDFNRLTGDVRYYSRIDFTGASYSYNGTDCGTNVFISEQCNPAWLGYDQMARTNMLFLTESNVPDKGHMREFEVRMFQSMNESFRLYRDDIPGGSYDEMTLIGDHVWQCVSIFTNPTPVNVHFQGLYAYTNGAYSRSVDFWTDNSKTNAVPPLNGFAAQVMSFTEVTNAPIGVSIPYKDTYMFRINVTNGIYQVRLATAQNFDTWQASDEYFEESLGLLEVENYITELSEVEPSTFANQLQTFIGSSVTEESEYNDVQSFNIQGWYGENSWCIKEPGAREPTDPGRFNQAIRLKSGPGYIRSGTSSGMRSNGREFFSFNHRVSFGGDEHVAYYKNGFDKQNYRLTTSVLVSRTSGAESYFEIMPYYYDEDNYYKLRVKYFNDSNAPSNGKVETRFVRVLNGQESDPLVCTNRRTSVNTAQIPGSNGIGGEWLVDMAILKPTTTNGLMRIEVNVICEALANVGTNSFCIYEKTDAAGALVNGGTVAFNVKDTMAVFNRIELRDLDADTAMDAPLAIGNTDVDFYTDTLGSAAAMHNWELGGKPVVNRGSKPKNLTSASSDIETTSIQRRWNVGVDSSAVQLYRYIPAVPFTVTQYRTLSEDNIPLPDMIPGDWSVLKLGEAVDLKYTNFMIDMKYWDYTFVRIRPDYADGDLVVDELDSRDWRGLTVSDLDSSDSPMTPADTNAAWVAYESVIGVRGNKHVVELTRSRANPKYKQMIVSPALYDGMGTMAFSYEVTGGPIDFVVERPSFSGQIDYSREADTPDNWQTELAVSAKAGDFGTQYVVVRTNMVGRMRIRIEDKGSEDDKATLWIGDMHITSYPDKGVNSWEAYNILVNSPSSAYKTDSENKYFELDLDHKTAFLNNSQTEGARNGQLMFEFQPYVQSPEIRNGIGEISFWYRTWDRGAANPGKLKLEMAPSSSGPWTPVVPNSGVGNEQLDHEYQAKLDSLMSIRNDTYEYFMIEIFNESNKVLRISCDTNDSARVAIDNIVVTEPVRTSIDVLDVRLTPDIPLGDQEIGVEVQLGNPRMGPYDINVVFEYYIGTNVWGVRNWSQDQSKYTRIPLVQDPSDPDGMRYISGTSGKIPGQPVDAVVQWRVRVDYKGLFASPVSYTAFKNPEWYEPIDLNAQFGGETNSDFWSPYYFVFSCSTGMVSFNEIFYGLVAGSVGASTEYIELIGQKNAPIGDWMLDVVDAEGSVDEDNVRVTYHLPSDAVISQNPTTNNWAFYVIADEEVALNSQVDFVMPDGGDPGAASSPDPMDKILPASGGFRLRRSMGAYVDRISYGASSVASDDMPTRGYTYTASKSNALRTRTIMLTQDTEAEGGIGLAWSRQSAANKSPGEVNIDEVIFLPYIEEFASQSNPVSTLITAAISDIQYMSQGKVRMKIHAVSAIETVQNFDGWTLIVQTNSTLENPVWGDLAQENGLPYTVEGTTEGSGAHIYDYDMVIPTDAEVMFFRVRADPPSGVGM